MKVLHLAPSSTAPSGIAGFGSHFRAGLRLAGLDVEHLPAPSGPDLSVASLRDYVRRVRLRSRQVDVVHAELGGAALGEFYAGLALVRDGGTATVVTVHDAPRPVWFPFFTAAIRDRRLLAGAVRRTTSPLADRLERELLRRTKHIYTLSELGQKSVLSRYAPHLPPVEVLAYPLASALRTRPRNARTVVAFHGYWYPGKGIEDLLRASAQAVIAGADLELRLFGDVSVTAGERHGRAYRNHVLQQVVDLGLTDRVIAPGHLAETEVAAQLGRADVVVLAYNGVTDPKLLASTSAAMHDALAAGTPVLASDSRSLPETIHEGVNGSLFPAGDCDRLAALLRRAHADRAWLSTLQAGAAAYAEAHSDSTLRAGRQAARAYRDVIESLGDQGRRRGTAR